MREIHEAEAGATLEISALSVKNASSVNLSDVNAEHIKGFAIRSTQAHRTSRGSAWLGQTW